MLDAAANFVDLINHTPFRHARLLLLLPVWEECSFRNPVLFFYGSGWRRGELENAISQKQQQKKVVFKQFVT